MSEIIDPRSEFQPKWNGPNLIVTDGRREHLALEPFSVNTEVGVEYNLSV